MHIQWCWIFGQRLREQILELVKRKQDGMGCSLPVVGARFRAELANELLVWEQLGAPRRAGGEAHRVRELGMVVSCGGSGEKGWSTELELGSGESLEDRHGTATLGTEPKRAGGLDQGGLWFSLRQLYCTE